MVPWWGTVVADSAGQIENSRPEEANIHLGTMGPWDLETTRTTYLFPAPAIASAFFTYEG